MGKWIPLQEDTPQTASGRWIPLEEESEKLEGKASIPIQLAKGIAAGTEQVIGGIGDMGYWAGQASGNEVVSDWGKNFSDKMTELSQTGWEAPDPEVMKGWEHPFRKSSYLIGSGAPSAAAAFIGSSVAGKGAKLLGASKKAIDTARLLGGVIPLGALVGSGTYREAREAGLTHNQATPLAFLSGAGEATLEVVPMTTWLRGGRHAGKRMFKVGVQEGIEEVVQGFWTNLIKVKGWKGTENLYKDLTEGLLESGIAGFGMGVTLGAMHPPSIEDVIDDTYNSVKNDKNGDTGKKFTREEVTETVTAVAEQIHRKQEDIAGRLKKKLNLPTDIEETTRPSFPIEVATLTPDLDNNYDITIDKRESSFKDSAEEKILEHEIQSLFGSAETGISWKDLPLDIKRELTERLKTEGKEQIPEIINSIINSNRVSTVGNVGKSPGASTPVFFAKRILWGKNPSTNIEQVVADMRQQMISPREVSIYSTQEGDSARVGYVLANVFEKSNIKTEEKITAKPETQADIAEQAGMESLKRQAEEPPNFALDPQGEVNAVRMGTKPAAWNNYEGINTEGLLVKKVKGLQIIAKTQDKLDALEKAINMPEGIKREKALGEALGYPDTEEYIKDLEEPTPIPTPEPIVQPESIPQGKQGIVVAPTEGKIEPLIEEAKKYSSPEEFVEAKTKKELTTEGLLTKSEKNIELLDEIKKATDKGFELTQKQWNGLINAFEKMDIDNRALLENPEYQKLMGNYIKKYDKNVHEEYFSSDELGEAKKGILLFDEAQAIQDYLVDNTDFEFLFNETVNKIFENMKIIESAKDALEISNYKSQLTDIWNKAHSTPTEGKVDKLKEFFKEKKKEEQAVKELEDYFEKRPKEPETKSTYQKRTSRHIWKPGLGGGGEESLVVPKGKGVSKEEIERQQQERIAEIGKEKAEKERLAMEEVPSYLGSTVTNDMSHRDRSDVNEEVVEEGEEKPDMTDEEIAEQERWNEGMRESGLAGRDTADYITSANEQLDGLIRTFENIKKSPDPAKKGKLDVLKQQINDIYKWLGSLNVNNDLYSINSGVVSLKQHFLNLREAAWVGDAVTGKYTKLHGYNEETDTGMISAGAYRLIDMGDGRIQITNTIQVTVYPSELLRILQQGGEFTNDPNLAAGGMQHILPNIKTDSGKTPPHKGMKDSTLRLKLILRGLKLFGFSEERAEKFLGSAVKDLKKAIQDPSVVPKVVKALMIEKHMNRHAAMMRFKVENDTIYAVRDFVEKDLKNRGHQITEELVTDETTRWLDVMQKANPEIIAVSNTQYAPSDQGLQAPIQPGLHDVDGEQKSLIIKYTESCEMLRRTPDPNILNMLKSGTRPEYLFWSMLPQQLKKVIMWGKSEIENFYRDEQTSAGVLDRADMNANLIRGFTKRAFDFSDEAHKAKYYERKYLDSTDVPHAKYRTYIEFEHYSGLNVDGAGLVPIVNYATALGMYAQEAINRTQQLKMIEMLKNIPNLEFQTKNPDQEPLGIITFLSDAAEMMKANVNNPDDLRRVTNYLQSNGYSEVKTSGLVEYIQGSFVRAWARNDIHDILDEMYYSQQSPKWQKNILKLNGVIKRTIMMMPYQYVLQIGSSPALWLGPVGAWKFYIKPMITFEALWKPVVRRLQSVSDANAKGYGWKYGLTQRLSDFEHIDSEPGYDPAKLDMFLQRGLNGFNMDTVMKNLYDSDISKTHPMYKSGLDDMKGFLLGKFGIDRYIFNHIVAKLMYNYADTMYERFIKEGHDSETAADMAVKFSNDTSGLLDSSEWSKSGQMFQLFMFARDFTFSFFKQITGASYPLWKHFHKYRAGSLSAMNDFLHGTVSSTDMDKLWKYYLSHLSRIFLAKALLVCLLQAAIVGSYRKRHPEDETVSENDQWAWINWKDPGKFGMIKTPYKDPENKAIYIDPLLFREISQMIALMPHPIGRGVGNYIKSKLSWSVNAAITLLTQQDFMGEPLTDQSGEINFGQRAMDVGMELGKSALPSFVRESPRVSPAFNSGYAVGFPLKRSSVGVGKGETLEENKELKAILSRERYSNLKRQKEVRMATKEELEKMVNQYFETNGEKGISPQTYFNLMMKFSQPGFYMKKENKKVILKDFFKRR